MEKCIFCEIILGRAESSIVHEDDVCLAFMDIQPVNPGHVLVAPREHATDLSDLPPETGAHLFQVAQRIALTLHESGVRCEGVDLLFAHGAAAGQDVFHAHMHVIPRYRGDGFGFKFGPEYEHRPGREKLDTIADLIRNHL